MLHCRLKKDQSESCPYNYFGKTRCPAECRFASKNNYDYCRESMDNMMEALGEILPEWKKEEIINWLKKYRERK